MRLFKIRTVIVPRCCISFQPEERVKRNRRRESETKVGSRGKTRGLKKIGRLYSLPRWIDVNRTILVVMTYKSWWPHNISAEITNNFCRAWAHRKWEMLALIIHSVANTFHRRGSAVNYHWVASGPVILIRSRPRRKPLRNDARSLIDSTNERKFWIGEGVPMGEENERRDLWKWESCVTFIILRNCNNASTRLPMSGVIWGLALIIIGMAGLSRFPNGHPSAMQREGWKSSNYRLLRIRSSAWFRWAFTDTPAENRR